MIGGGCSAFLFKKATKTRRHGEKTEASISLKPEQVSLSVVEGCVRGHLEGKDKIFRRDLSANALVDPLIDMHKMPIP
jgi:hypothetical protein